MFFERVLYPPLNLKLLQWQADELRTIFGDVDSKGARRIRHAFISMAKKNGKSFWVGGLPIYHLVGERAVRPEAYGAAAAKDQASIVFRAAAALVNANPALKDKLRVLDSTKRIVARDGSGFYQVISADGDVQDGMEPSLGLLDELHRWTTEKADTLYSVITKGMISRPEGLAVRITTAGDPYKSQLWKREYEHAKRVIAGTVEDRRYHARIFEADIEKLKIDDDYWMSREARIAANPSHEDNPGGFLKDENIAEDIPRAIEDPNEKRKFFRLNLNVSPDTIAEGVIDMKRWFDCGGGVDLREWPEYDYQLLVRKWGLLDRPCYAGVDASWSIDLTAGALVFPPVEDGEPWSVLVQFWMPEEVMREREKRDKVTYGKWAQQGFIQTIPGRAIEDRPIKEWIKKAAEMFELREVCYDPWNFRKAAAELQDDGVTCVEIKQGYALLSEPTKKLLHFYTNGELRHGNNPVLNFCANCLDLLDDHKDNVQPKKPDRAKSSKRIDGMSATVTAMARAVQYFDSSTANFYADGLMVL